MAAINETAPESRRPRFARQKKTTLRIDMTPMVDLGFLLITFFIFTTSLSDKKTMFLAIPDDRPTPSPILLKNTLALTLLIDKNNKVYYYNGNFKDAQAKNAILPTDYSVYHGIGDVIREKQKAVEAAGADKEGRKGIMLLIKPTEGASYKNLVDALDEILINDLKKYAIVEASAEETAWLQGRHR